MTHLRITVHVLGINQAFFLGCVLNDVVEKLGEVVWRSLRHVLKLKARAIVNRGYLKAGGFLDSSPDGLVYFDGSGGEGKIVDVNVIAVTDDGNLIGEEA